LGARCCTAGGLEHLGRTGIAVSRRGVATVSIALNLSGEIAIDGGFSFGTKDGCFGSDWSAPQTFSTEGREVFNSHF
ncbi:MAG: hypothetical protein AAFY15_16390, partial [Cyanobacteria bacterium J06648_11]